MTNGLNKLKNLCSVCKDHIKSNVSTMNWIEEYCEFGVTDDVLSWWKQLLMAIQNGNLMSGIHSTNIELSPLLLPPPASIPFSTADIYSFHSSIPESSAALWWFHAMDPWASAARLKRHKHFPFWTSGVRRQIKLVCRNVEINSRS